MMKLRAVVIFGLIFPQIFSVSISPPAPDCSALYACISDLCKNEKALNNGVCDGEACQIKGSQLCNMTIQAVVDQFPSLQECVCDWEEVEEEQCDSMRALNAQCRPDKVAHQQRRVEMDWQTSTLINSDGTGSCLDRMKTCLSDSVCNKNLAPVLQVCTAQQCNHERCRQVTQEFYSSMPLSVAEKLVLCECEESDQSCLHMKQALHSSTCGDSMWICQETVKKCAEDQTCRKLLKTFQEKCWSTEEAQCSDTDLDNDECFTQMYPALILGADSECKTAFLGTLGTVLHHPCTCKGVYGDDLLGCDMIHRVFHNRSYFTNSGEKSSNGPSKPLKINESETFRIWSNEYLVYIFASLLLVGVVILMPLAVISKIWMLKGREKTKYQHPQKSSIAVIL